MVHAYRPLTRRDASSRDEVLRAVEELEKPFSRDAQAIHITTSSIVAGARGTVLHRHKITGTWLQPGGHVDDGEAPWETALRELLEETGLRGRHRDATRLFDIDVHDTPRGHRHLDLRFLIDVDDVDPQASAGESAEVRWFSWDDALREADPSLREVLPKALTWGS